MKTDIPLKLSRISHIALLYDARYNLLSQNCTKSCAQPGTTQTKKAVYRAVVLMQVLDTILMTSSTSAVCIGSWHSLGKDQISYTEALRQAQADDTEALMMNASLQWSGHCSALGRLVTLKVDLL